MKAKLLFIGFTSESLSIFSQATSLINADVAGNKVIQQGFLYNNGRQTAYEDLDWETLNAINLHNTYNTIGVTESRDEMTQDDFDADGAGSMIFTYDGSKTNFVWI